MLPKRGVWGSKIAESSDFPGASSLSGLVLYPGPAGGGVRPPPKPPDLNVTPNNDPKLAGMIESACAFNIHEPRASKSRPV